MLEIYFIFFFQNFNLLSRKSCIQNFTGLETGFFFAQFSGNAKQGFVRDFELDHFLSQLDGKKSELGNFYLIFQQFFNKIMAILFENLS